MPQLRADRLETLGNLLSLHVAAAFHQQAIDQTGNAMLVAIARTAGLEAQAHIDHRQIVAFHEQNLHAVAGFPALDIQRLRGLH